MTSANVDFPRGLFRLLEDPAEELELSFPRGLLFLSEDPSEELGQLVECPDFGRSFVVVVKCCTNCCKRSNIC